MNKQTENLPILQDFVPYRGAVLPPPMKIKEKVEQGKGTADHLMPLGYFIPSFLPSFLSSFLPLFLYLPSLFLSSFSSFLLLLFSLFLLLLLFSFFLLFLCFSSRRRGVYLAAAFPILLASSASALVDGPA